MDALFVALGIMVLALLVLLLWFVPHLLQQQAVRVAGETTQLREMLLDLLNEQEAVAVRQSQLGTSLSNLQAKLETLADSGALAPQPPDGSAQQLEARLSDIQQQLGAWVDGWQRGDRQRTAQDNESWAYLMSLLAAIQERVGALSQDRAAASAGARAGVLLEELEHEMVSLRTISEDIARIQQRLRRSLTDHESSLPGLRTHLAGNGVESIRVRS